MDWLPFYLILAVCGGLLLGYPVAPTLAGVSLLFAGLGQALGAFDPALLAAMTNRLYGIMTNETLVAVPLFIFMGVTLERSRVAERLLDTAALLFGSAPGGLAIAVTLVGMLLAASTGVVGATVVTMGLLSLPTMLRRGYEPALACGVICAAGALGQIIPPSIVLVLLGDVLSSAQQQAQAQQGDYAAAPVSVGDLFAGALLPGLLLVGLYLLYLLWVAWRRPAACPAIPADERPLRGWALARRALAALLPALALILAVLGSILAGLATPTEAAGVGAVGALLLALLQGGLNLAILQQIMRAAVRLTSMAFFILLGASAFSLVFRGLGGDEAVGAVLAQLPGGAVGAMTVVMGVMFLLGFVLDFVEIIFVVVPIVGPPLLALGLNPLWLGVMLGVNLQTSFLTPPFGYALFYLRGVAPAAITTGDIYRGVAPFIALQLLGLIILAAVPALATWLPGWLYR